MRRPRSAVRNRAASQARHEGAHRRFLSRVLTFGNPPESLPADRDVIAGDEAARVRRAIANLPPRCREVVVLVRLNGMTHAEAAIVLGIEPKTVEVHMGRAVKLLRAALKVG